MLAHIKKYWTIFILSWQNGFVYRVSFLLWRFRQLLSTVMALTIWSVVFSNQSSAFGYAPGQMLSYVLLVTFLQSLILATSLHGLAGEIYSGSISHHLLKPEKLFLSFASVEAADKLKNLLFSLLEGMALILIFHPPISWPAISNVALFLVWTILGILINFYISIWFGTLGFWSPQTWGPKFLFFMFVDFTAGKLYPLDILPPLIQKVLFLTPFPYLSYAQTQAFLNRIPTDSMPWWWAGILLWTVLSWWVARSAWHKGLKNYEATGL